MKVEENMKRFRFAVVVMVCCALSCVVEVATAGEGAGKERMEKMRELRGRQRELRMQMREVEKNLNLHADPDLTALRDQVDAARVAYNDARKAYDDKVAEKLRQDPDGAVLQQEMEELDAQLSELMPSHGKGGPERMKKEREQAGAKGKKNEGRHVHKHQDQNDADEDEDMDEDMTE